MSLVHQFLKDLTMGTVGLIDIALGLMIVASPSLPFIRVLGSMITVGGVALILIVRR